MKRLLLVLAAAACLTGFAPAGGSAFNYDESVDSISLSPTTAYDTVYLGMPRGDFDANFSALTDWKYYGNTTERTEKAERSTGNDKDAVVEGIAIYTAEPSKNSRVLAFDNYFKTKDKKTAREIYKRLRATIYSSMSDFPRSQRRGKVVWVDKDVTISVSYTGQRDEEGWYVVSIRRYNNRMLKK